MAEREDPVDGNLVIIHAITAIGESRSRLRQVLFIRQEQRGSSVVFDAGNYPKDSSFLLSSLKICQTAEGFLQCIGCGHGLH